MRRRCLALMLAGVMMFGQNVYARELNGSEPQAEQVSDQEEVSDIAQTDEELKNQSAETTDSETNEAEQETADDEQADLQMEKSVDLEGLSEELSSVMDDTITQADCESASDDSEDNTSMDEAVGSETADVLDASQDTNTSYSVYDFLYEDETPEEVTYLYIGEYSNSSHITDLSELSKFNNLEHLELYNVDNSDISALSSLTGLVQLSFVDCDNITDISVLSKLDNLRFLSLRASDNISDLSPLSGLNDLYSLDISETNVKDISSILKISNLQWLSASDTQVSPAQLLQFVKQTVKTTLYKGDMFSIGLNSNYDMVLQSDNTNCVYAEYGEYIAKNAGTAKLSVSLGNESFTFTVLVEGIDEKQPVGTSVDVSVSTPDYVSTDTVLLNNSELWELYPDVKRVSNDTKKYVGAWVYSGRDVGLCRYRLDQNGNLWSGTEKIADGVADFSGHYILTKSGVLKDIYNTDAKSLNDVVAWQEVRTDTYTNAVYALKSDKTLWCRSEVEKNKQTNAFSKVADNVAYLAEYGYVDSSGAFHSFSGKLVMNGLCPSGKSAATIKTINFANRDWDDSISQIVYTEVYILYENGELYYHNHNKDSTVLLAKNVVWFNASYEYCCYKTADGKYYSGYLGQIIAASEEEPAIAAEVGEYVLYMKSSENDGIVKKNEIPILDHVADLISTLVYTDPTDWGRDKVYALRTDGTIWSLDGIPKKVDLKAVTYETGFYEIGGQNVYYENGVRSTLTGVVMLWDKNWYYLKNGVLQKGPDIASNENGWWYVNKDGKIDFTYTGMFCSTQHGWIYIGNGKWNTSYTGMAKNQYGWWYMNNGKLDQTYTGMAKNQYGWWHMKNGKLDQTYTGLSSNAYGTWYVKKGKLDTSFTGMYKDASKGWVYVNKGKWDTSYTDVAKNAYGQWYMVKGRLDTSLTGMYKAKSQGWIYVNKGKWDTGYTGMAKNAYGWWYMKNGKLDQTYTGMAKNQYGWWYMKNGKLDKSFTGIAKNQYGSWYMVKGKLAGSYSGTVTWNAKKYKVTKGKAVLA